MTKTFPFAAMMLALSACADEVESDGSARIAVCERVETERIAVNGKDINGIQNNALTGNGTSLAGVSIDGRPTAGASLRGVRADGTSIDLLVASEHDGLFELTHEGTNVCAGGAKGIFVAGVWDARGARHDSPLSTFACASGAIAKCVLWGYDPAKVGAAMHQSCTRMVRADYCGDGVSSTRNGTAIDVSDTRGVQTAANEPDFLFEAGWNENGATCVNRSRIAGLVPPCWRDLPTCASSDEAIARGASLMNASRLICR